MSLVGGERSSSGKDFSCQRTVCSGKISRNWYYTQAEDAIEMWQTNTHKHTHTRLRCFLMIFVLGRQFVLPSLLSGFQIDQEVMHEMSIPLLEVKLSRSETGVGFQAARAVNEKLRKLLSKNIPKGIRLPLRLVSYLGQLKRWIAANEAPIACTTTRLWCTTISSLSVSFFFAAFLSVTRFQFQAKVCLVNQSISPGRKRNKSYKFPLRLRRPRKWCSCALIDHSSTLAHWHTHMILLESAEK